MCIYVGSTMEHVGVTYKASNRAVSILKWMYMSFCGLLSASQLLCMIHSSILDNECQGDHALN